MRHEVPMIAVEEQARIVFLEALEGAPNQWTALLDQRCAGNAELRARVELLLHSHQAMGSIHGERGLQPSPTLDLPVPAESPGATIGQYKLLEQIGEGGFGLVFVAEQTEPVKRKVALKVIKPGMDTREVMARFAAERQALAIMDHPNIAKVFDGGATPTGRPYFVMELVRGVPITEYCDQQKLSPRQRLELFATVCQAVQHAHQKGIIHRDLKPSNVLVSRHDTTPIVKVIDFGVAKAMGPALTDKTFFTGIAQMIGTPLYMSPEQAGMSDLDIDTRSDIYSLGVLLYELLTGSTPFTKERFKEAAYDEIRRIIREEEPPKPSTRLSTSDTLPNIAANRGLEPKRLSGLVRGELDWIVMKALEKDRNRRYETANGLATDVQRYLADEPVAAGPPSAGYRLRKFVQRNKGPVLAASVVLVAILSGTAVSAWQAVRATAAANAERAANVRAQKRLAQIEKGLELFAGMLNGIDPRTEEKGDEPLYAQLRQKAEKAAAELDCEAVGDPLAVARLQTILGNTLRELGSYEAAVAVLLKAWATRERELGADHSDTLTTLHNLAGAYHDAGNLPEAIRLLEQVRDAFEAQLGRDHTDTLTTLNALALANKDVGRMPEAIRLYEIVRDARLTKLGADHPSTLVTLNNLATAYQAVGNLPEAIRLLEQVRDALVTKRGPGHPDTLTALNNLAAAYQAGGNLPEAIRLYEQVRDFRVKKLGSEHPYTLATLNNLATAYHSAGKLPEAITLLEQVRNTTTARLGAEHPFALGALMNLASVYKADGKLSEAIRLFEQVRDVQMTKLGAEHLNTLITLSNLASAYQADNKLPEAIKLFEQVRDVQMTKSGTEHPDTLNTLFNLASAYKAADRLPEAIRLFEQVREIQVTKLGNDHPDTLSTLNYLAWAYQAAGRLPEALPLYEQAAQGIAKRQFLDRHAGLIMANTIRAYEAAGQLEKAEAWQRQWLPVVKEKFGQNGPAYARELTGLGLLLVRQRKCTEAAEVLRDSLTIRERAQPEDWPTFNTMSLLGGALLGQKKYDDAEPLLLKGYEGMKTREKSIPKEARIRIAEAVERLVQLYEATDKKGEAANWRKQLETSTECKR
jgi:serine/threonine protein kinase/tetratricopeptide (TPR) repeat protein